MSPAGAPEAGRVDAAAADALQDALAAEHAALWCLALAVAFLPADAATQARADAADHRALRAAVEQTLTDVGARPVSALPAYATPEPVTDAASAAELVLVAETDALTAWHSVLERTGDPALRRAALDALTDGTLRTARWRVAAGRDPVIPVLPGRA